MKSNRSFVGSAQSHTRTIIAFTSAVHCTVSRSTHRALCSPIRPAEVTPSPSCRSAAVLQSTNGMADGRTRVHRAHASQSADFTGDACNDSYVTIFQFHFISFNVSPKPMKMRVSCKSNTRASVSCEWEAE